ncbi:hypothetical protein [Lysinibacillus pakistanensis]|uniref:DUF771 domain-containing protein n=1 Tax=Lysinibacillus pakistanensis TaxID=759811 RepID=A0ABX6DEY3_9BACI|nr:hypothetical protein GDS87_11690 [Lysinibacillus pakistanensis]
MLPNQPNENMLVQELFKMGGITKESIQQDLKNLINEASQGPLLFWDLKKMTKSIPYCEKTIEDKIIKPDPRWIQYQRRSSPDGKKIWLFEPTSKFMVDYIMNNWYI